MAAKPMFYTVRKHWKKSIFAACVSLYGSYYACGRFREYLVRREICAEARKIGEEPIEALQKPRRMFVFLNPQANNGGAVKMYERNVAPLLHLAAIDVTLIKTDYEGHAKSIMGYIDPTIDGIIVAGGDGTLMEVITGLVRLQNEETISKIPLGVIPLGKTNSFFKNFHNNGPQNARNLGNATMAVIKGETKLADVMEISTQGARPTYALSSLCWGVFQEVKVKIDAKKHWWAGPWKKQMAFILRSVKSWPSNYVASLTTSNDNISGLKQVYTAAQSEGKRSKVDESLDTQESSISNRDDSLVQENGNNVDSPLQTMNGLQLQINNASKERSIKMQIWDDNLSRIDFIADGIKWIKNDYNIIESRNCKIIQADQLKLSPSMNDVTWYHIDGEEFEAKTVEVKILRNKLRFFH